MSKKQDYSEATGREIDLAVRGLVDEAFAHATSVLVERRHDLEAGASLLIERETLTSADFPALAPPEKQRPEAAE